MTGVVVWGEEDENIVLVRRGQDESYSRLMKSTDGGQSWTLRQSVWGAVLNFVQSPADSLRLLSGLLYSSDGGENWHAGSWPGVGDWPDELALDPIDSLTGYMVGTNSIDVTSIYKTTDGGASWVVSCWPGCSAHGLAVEQSHSGYVIGVQGEWSVVSTDAGETWMSRPGPNYGKDVGCPRWSPGSFLAVGASASGTDYGVWQSWDLGETWVECGEGLPPAPEEWTWSLAHIAAHPTEPDLYVALEGSGVWRWRLQGAVVPAAVPGRSGMGLSIHPNPTPGSFAVRVYLPTAERARLDLIDAGGRLVRRLHEGSLDAGEHALSAAGVPSAEAALASGVYHVVLTLPEGRIERRLVVVR